MNNKVPFHAALIMMCVIAFSRTDYDVCHCIFRISWLL